MYGVRDRADCTGAAGDGLSRPWRGQRGLGQKRLVFLPCDACKGVVHESIAVDV